MFRNMKVGVRITLGFILVLLLLIALSVTVVLSDITSNNNLREIMVMMDFKAATDKFKNSFNEAQTAASALNIRANASEYERTNRAFSTAMATMDEMTGQIDGDPILAGHKEKFDMLILLVNDWKTSVDQLNDQNNALDEMRVELEKTEVKLTQVALHSYKAQTDALHADIGLSRNDNDRRQAENRLNSVLYSVEILQSVYEAARSFQPMLNANDITDVYDHLAKIDTLQRNLTAYIGESENTAGRDARRGDLDAWIYTEQELNNYKDIIRRYSLEVTNQNNLVTSTRSKASRAAVEEYTLITQINETIAAEVNQDIERGVTVQWTAAGLSLLAVLIGGLIALLVIRSITRPITAMAEEAIQLSHGNMDISHFDYHANDEIGVLAHNMRKMAAVVRDLIRKMMEMAAAHQEGDMDARVDESLFTGGYRELAVNYNALTDSYIRHMHDIMDCLEHVGSGNFNWALAPLPGKKAGINHAVDAFQDNLKGIAAEINKLVEAAHEGDFSVQADADRYKGDWAGILKKLNTLVKSIIDPVNEAFLVMQNISAGRFDQKVTGDYKGEFITLKNAVNNTVDQISVYINEISYLLTQLAADNLDLTVRREYVGDFAGIKTALIQIINKYNQVITDISAAAAQVTDESRQISENSLQLAQGASEQAASIQELNATLITINETTVKNAREAEDAENLSGGSRESATAGDKEMQDMLVSMEAIKESSRGIANIISVIDGIAFQTNLLALNAAVEAARAGEHGKGFAVVAGEVRSLATRSQDAAGETAQLIDESIRRVDEGTRIAERTAGSLRGIVDSANRVAALISDLSAGSREQANEITQIANVLSQITNVVQRNSAVSQESAAAAEQLTAQAERLHGMVSVFKLKG